MTKYILLRAREDGLLYDRHGNACGFWTSADKAAIVELPEQSDPPSPKRSRSAAMDDRTMLELAAKAAGMQASESDGVIYAGFGSREWNPLTDDGDALRLAVKIGRSRTLQLVVGVGGADCQFDHPLVTAFESGDDPYAATRRAIVRAAAEIGRGMK